MLLKDTCIPYLQPCFQLNNFSLYIDQYYQGMTNYFEKNVSFNSVKFVSTLKLMQKHVL
jgi:hypothetical protein